MTMKMIILVLVSVAAAIAAMFGVLQRAWRREGIQPRQRTVADSIAEATNVHELRAGPNRKKPPREPSAGGDAA